MSMFTTLDFWVAVGQIILIDILLGGDNAVVIALACRSLPPQQRLKGIIWGTAGAIVLRVLLIFFALTLLQIPFLKLAGAVLLVWIGVKLLLPEDEGGDAHGNVAASDKLWGAVKTVIVADLVMSVDNVIAIAGAAESVGGDHTMPLVIFGLLVSIPIIVWGSQLVLKLMDRFPIVITLGGLLLGWIAGTMAVTDPGLANWLSHHAMPDPATSTVLRYGAGIAGALLVLLLGWLFTRRGEPVAALPRAARPTRPVHRVLLAVDGSKGATAAARQVLAMHDELQPGQSLDLHVVNVQRPLTEDVARFISGKTIDEYHREKSEAIIAQARAALGELASTITAHHVVGEPGQAIADLARDLDCDLIVMGARGLGARTAALLGSVTQSTLERATVPVQAVK